MEATWHIFAVVLLVLSFSFSKERKLLRETKIITRYVGKFGVGEAGGRGAGDKKGRGN